MKRNVAILFLFLMLLPVGLGAAPVAPSEEAPRLHVVEHTLKNGMKFLIVPRKVSPTVAAYIRFKVGGVDDPAGQTGIAHLLEHMMFKGTTTFGTTSFRAEKPLMEKEDRLNLELQEILYRRQTSHFYKADEHRIGELRAEIAKALGEQKKLIVKNELDEAYSRLGGIGLNASTSSDYTTYVIQLPSNALEAWAYIEADRIANPVFREFYSERDVVHEERRRSVDTQSRGLLGEAFDAAVWTAHPYRNPVVGWSSDIDNTKREEVLAFFRTYYAPNNAIAAVVGDVDPREVIRLAEKYFGPIPSQPKPFRTLPIEPPQHGERRITVRFDASPALQIGYPIPAIGHPDAPALEVVGNLLSGVRGGGGRGGSRTTRFFQAITQKGLGQASADGGTGPYPNVFGITATPRRPTTPEQLEQAIYAEIERLQTEPVPERELERVRNQIDAQMVRAGGSNAGIAMRLLTYEAMTGDVNYYYRHRELLKAVTAADVMRVAKQYLTPEKRTVATLVPTSDGGRSGSGPPRRPGGTAAEGSQR
jgi:predicted Zn-dependent peptidase